MKALVVDDSRMIRRIVRRALEAMGYEPDNVVEAADGAAAIDAYADLCEGLRLVLLDWNLPETDGISVLKYIRASCGSDFPSVVMVTSLADDSDKAQAMDAGATGYITKPFTPDTLARKLKTVLSD